MAMTATYYFDSIALVKRYVTEAGTGWIRSLIAPAGSSLSLISRLTIVEVRSALVRRKRERAISGDLLEHHPLRAYDAVQLASALIVARALTGTGMGAPIFLTADDRLLDVARAEGLPTDNPNWHS
jgi:predicted nucleic acid-binding protein